MHNQLVYAPRPCKAELKVPLYDQEDNEVFGLRATTLNSTKEDLGLLVLAQSSALPYKVYLDFGHRGRVPGNRQVT